MNHCTFSWRALRAAGVGISALALMSACGFKGPLVLPPEPSRVSPPVEQYKIDGATQEVPSDAHGMGVKK